MQSTTTKVKAMRQDQIKYVTSRAESILTRRLDKLRQEHRSPSKTLTNREKAEALQEGRFTIDLDRVTDGHYGNWYGAVTFTDERSEVTNPQYYVDASEIRKQYDKLMDELMLGDNAQALELLRQFENDNGET